ncbi:cyclic AMP-dependent transcription factor ATF-1 isoform X2 [Labrus mixtus]|uniref:cyclic AMP-dependent transcription factor ATF-1 isoform X2 n=1 Tax=Labrus mixtus TaxID=508554 RepID=UPI0029C065BF|nr:cyclic AMP-dependent transcription factor ATF-1 isoform X2 [Labrus mixtus]
MEEVHQGSNGTDSQTAIIPTSITTSQFSQIAQQMSLAGSSVALVQMPGGQFQVQGVIQSAQSSVIQSPQGQTAQIRDSDSEDSQDSSDSGGVTAQKTREILARRPSYRKILNELSSEEVTHIEVKDNSPASTGVTGVTVPTTPIYQTSSGQYITISANGTIQLATPGSEGIQGLQAVAMANSGGAQQGTTILQYAQTPDGQQILVPSNQVVVQGGEMQAYQIRTAPSSSLPQTVVMTSPVGKSDDPTMKREIRLAKNREAARECRRKKKEYVKCLENRVAVLENQNKTLIEELKTLKDLYCVKTG